MENLVYQVLHSTNIFSEEKFHKMYEGNNHSLKESIEQSQRLFRCYDKEEMDLEVLEVIIDGMVDYVETLPTPVSYKVDLWKKIVQWISIIAIKYNMEQPAKEILQGYDELYQASLVIELVKNLHDRAGQTKAELSEKLQVSEKTIQTMLRQLDSDMIEGKAKKECKGLYVAGQQVKAKISFREENDGKGHIKRRFYTPNSVHPIFLQENIMQVGSLLRALAFDYLNYEHAISRGIAIDVWCQLSDYAKERIRMVFGSSDDTMMDFLEEIDMEIAEDIPLGYLTEREMIKQQDLSISELLQSACKRGAKVDITYFDDGLETTLKEVMLERGEKNDSYILSRSNNKIAVVSEQDINKIIFLK